MTAPISTQTVGPAGGATTATLTPAQVQKVLVQPLQAASIFLRQGVHFYDSNGAPVRVPKAPVPNEASPTFVAEGADIPTLEYNFDELVLLPSTMKSIKTWTPFTNELARQFVVSLDAALQARLVADVAGKLDNVLLTSAVTDKTQPLGLEHYAGIQTMATVGAVSIDVLYDAEELALAASVNENSLRWIIRTPEWKKIRKLKASGSGEYLVQPDPTKRAARTLLGYPATISNRLSSGVAVLADFSQIAVARDLTPTVRIFDQTLAKSDSLAIRVVTRYDALPENPQAVVLLTGIT